MRAGYRTRDHEGGQFGYTWGAAEVGAALYAEHSTHCLYIGSYCTVYASAPAVEQRLGNSYFLHVTCVRKNYSRFPLGTSVEITRENSRSTEEVQFILEITRGEGTPNFLVEMIGYGLFAGEMQKKFVHFPREEAIATHFTTQVRRISNLLLARS